MKITMKKIAQDLNISIMTVSRYFNDGYVSAENREKIAVYVEKHNYSPNMFAQNLKSESNIIGFITARMDSYTATQTVKGIIKQAEQSNMRVLFHATNYDSDSEDKAIREFQALNAKGIIIVATQDTIKKQDVVENEKIVIVGQKCASKNTIYYPEEKAISELVNENFSKVIYFYKQETLSERKEYVKTIFQLQDQDIILASEMSQHIQNGYLYICSTDEVAYDLYKELRKTKLVIGKDVFVVGVGDYKYNELVAPSLTSIAYPYEQAGADAVRIINGELKAGHQTEYQVNFRESYNPKLGKINS
ncbi:MAG: LacI family DNA-binding transcriptional regulator [Mycoplasmatales bacterium]